MSVEQDSSTQKGASEAKERRRIQEEQEKIRQREINAARPPSPQDDGPDVDDTQEANVVRSISFNALY